MATRAVTMDTRLRILIAHWDQHGPAGGFSGLIDEARVALREHDRAEAMADDHIWTEAIGRVRQAEH